MASDFARDARETLGCAVARQNSNVDFRLSEGRARAGNGDISEQGQFMPPP